MNDNPLDLDPLRNAIRHYGMMGIWGDSIQELSADERRARAQARALEARDVYIRLMRSARNDGTDDYQGWAIKKALGLRASKGYTAQATGGKNWQAWGKAKV